MSQREGRLCREERAPKHDHLNNVGVRSYFYIDVINATMKHLVNGTCM